LLTNPNPLAYGESGRTSLNAGEDEGELDNRMEDTMDDGIGDNDEAMWRRAVETANIPTLLLVLVQLTGNERWIEAPFLPSRPAGLSDNDTGGLGLDLQREVRDAAFNAIVAWRSGAPVVLADPPSDLLLRMFRVSQGDDIPQGYVHIIRHELGLESELADQRPVEPDALRLTAIIIGAGMSGICASVRLHEEGVDHVLLERNADVGGTWIENRYPGCGVDVPSHLYTYSFAPNDWTHYFALRDEIHEYFRRVAREHGIYERTQFGTEVIEARFDETASEWVVTVQGPDEVQRTLRANLLISAVGAFNKPKLPDLVGMGLFEGPQFHTARWPEGLDISGKRVAIVGTGASSMQIVPAIADQAERVLIFQRTPQWAAPFERFQQQIPEEISFLLRNMPLYAAWYRLRIGWAFNDRIYDALQVDPNWEYPARSLNAINDGQRRALTRYAEEQLGDRVDLRETAIPTYPPFGKRMLLDNGWFKALTRADVELHAEAVHEVTATGLITESGAAHDVDVIVWATGFDVVSFIAPIQIYGRNGLSLHQRWDGDDARAYLGTAIPAFPNLFVLYGPNTQFGHGGSLVTVIERQISYLLDLFRQMRNDHIRAVEVRSDVHDAYNQRVDEAHRQMVWMHPGMDTYYRNSKGRVTVNNPFRMVDVWAWTASASLPDYLTTR
jgi:4-hydroxyacetophenone monooxygenase